MAAVEVYLCSAHYEHCTGKVSGPGKLCSACLNDEIEYARNKISDLKVELNVHQKEVERLSCLRAAEEAWRQGITVPAYAVTD